SIPAGMVEGIGSFDGGDWHMNTWQITLEETLAQIYPQDVESLKRTVTAHFAVGGSFLQEIRLQDFDKNPRWFLVSGRVILDVLGKPHRVIGITIEITQNKQMELELNRQRRLMEWVMANIPAFIGLTDSQSRHIYANENLLRFLGVSLANVLGKTNEEIYTPDLAIIFDYMDRQILLKKKPLQTEVSVITNGIERFYLANKFPLLNEEGEVEAIGTIATDITGLKQAEDTILENQAYLNCLIEIQQQLLMYELLPPYPATLRGSK
ncbi:MAG: PAS domain-containing protein, partial [Pseudanabaenaceae cyanobacterium]